MVITNTFLSGDGTYSPLQRSVTRFKSLRLSLRNLVCAIAECHTLYTSKRNRDSISLISTNRRGLFFFYHFEASAFLIFFLRYTGEARMQRLRLWLKNPPGTGGGQDVEHLLLSTLTPRDVCIPFPKTLPANHSANHTSKPKRSKKKKEKTRPAK